VIKDIKIRKFKRSDTQSLHRMVQNSIDVSYRGFYPPEAVNYFKEYHSKKDMLQDASAGYTLIADCNGEILGTGTLLGTNIRRVYVNPLHQHQGIGKLIVAALEKKASREMIASIDLEASLVSKRFWESCGYQIDSENFIPLENGQKLNYYNMVKTISNDK
jgi:GNAT superfamily N-acetyltransferase